MARPPRVIQLFHEFDMCPAEYLDESRRADFCPEPLPPALWDSARARMHLSRHILGTLGLPPCTVGEGAPWTVALLDAERLRQLAMYVAAAVASTQVRTCLLREDVAAWREWLSPAPFAFAQATAPLLPLNLPSRVAIDRGVTAQSFGLRWLARAALAWPAEIAGRFLLKMPGHEADQPIAADETLAARVAASLVGILEPQWCSSLAANPT